jgi:hypothetical protein
VSISQADILRGEASDVIFGPPVIGLRPRFLRVLLANEGLLTRLCLAWKSRSERAGAMSPSPFRHPTMSERQVCAVFQTGLAELRPCDFLEETVLSSGL